jgi:transposase
MGRLGLDVTSHALNDQTMAMAEELRPCYQALEDAILRESVMGMDETGWKLMGSEGRDYRAVIAMSSPSASIFHFAEGKSTEVIKPLLESFSGTLVVDGYKAYPAIAEDRDDLLIANCWAHAVRRFRAAAKDFPIAETAMKLIGKLFEIDRRAGPFPGDEEVRRRRQRLRKKESTVVLRSLRRWLVEQLPKVPKRTTLGNAISYTLSLWKGLSVFVDDPNVPLDNNGTERDLRQVVQGRKNHYGSRSDRGLETAAILYSLVQTCMKIGVDPEEYLSEATRSRRLDEPRTLLPSDLKADSAD